LRHVPRAVATPSFATSAVASASASLQLVTPQEVDAKIIALQKLANEVASDQFLLKTISDSLSAVMDRCHEKLIEKNIARKSLGAKFVSNIENTKARGNSAQKATVFPGRGNNSPIGIFLGGGSGGGIATATQQTHPGKATKPKEQQNFCDDCGKYVTSKRAFCEIRHSHTFSDFVQHQTKTAAHIRAVGKGVKYVDCELCKNIHSVGACPQ
jgi:hypothetical protein